MGASIRQHVSSFISFRNLPTLRFLVRAHQSRTLGLQRLSVLTPDSCVLCDPPIATEDFGWPMDLLISSYFWSRRYPEHSSLYCPWVFLHNTYKHNIILVIFIEKFTWTNSRLKRSIISNSKYTENFNTRESRYLFASTAIIELAVVHSSGAHYHRRVTTRLEHLLGTCSSLAQVTRPACLPVALTGHTPSALFPVKWWRFEHRVDYCIDAIDNDLYQTNLKKSLNLSS